MLTPEDVVGARESADPVSSVISPVISPVISDVVSAAVFVVSATQSIPDAVIDAWDTCDDLGLPRIIVICDIDSSAARTDDLIEQCQEALGDMVPVLALHLPLLSDDGDPIALIDLLSEDIIDYSTGDVRRIPAEQRHRDLVRDERTWLVEAVIAETDNDSLVAEYLSGHSPDPSTLTDEFYATVKRGRLHPILLTATSPSAFGLDQIVDVSTRGFPISAQPRP